MGEAPPRLLMSWLDWFKPAPKAPVVKPQPSVEEVKLALQRRFSRTYHDPTTGGRLTTAPPEREAGPTGPTAEEIEALKTNWIIRGPGR